MPPGRAVTLGALAAVLAAVLATAGCSAGPAGSGVSTASAPPAAAPAITAARARQVFNHYVAVAAKATSPRLASPVLSVVTGPERAVFAAALARRTVQVSGLAPSGRGGTGGPYRSTLTVRPGFDAYSYGSPTFYLPEAGGYPRFFVASVTRTLRGAAAGNDGMATTVGGARLPQDGPVLMLFTQSDVDSPWLLASVSQLPVGMTVPSLAKDGSGYIRTAVPSAADLLAPPTSVGALQAAVVDEGPASAAAKAVAPGPLTTGLYADALHRVNGMTVPRGDVYQWELAGASYPEFALRTADGGALVCYAMTLNASVAVPDVVNDANPIRRGPPIQVPLALRMLLPQGQPTPLVELQSQQTLTFAAIDPPRGPAKVRVIAIGGGLTSASAS